MIRVTLAQTPEAKAIWQDVKNAADQCPEWVRPMVRQAAKEFVQAVNAANESER